MAVDARPLNGYVDPKYPSPNGPNDAPVIIYGYVSFTSIDLLTSLIPRPAQLYPRPLPRNLESDPLCRGRGPSPLPSLSDPALGLLHPLHYHCTIRSRGLYLPPPLHAPTNRQPLRRHQLCCPVLLHRRRSCVPVGRNLHNPDLPPCCPWRET